MTTPASARWRLTSAKVQALGMFRSALGDDNPRDPQDLAHVSVDTVETDLSASFTVFVCSVQLVDGRRWLVKARFRQFRALWKTLAHEVPYLPFPRRTRAALGPVQLEERRLQLDVFLRGLNEAELTAEADDCLRHFLGAPEREHGGFWDGISAAAGAAAASVSGWIGDGDAERSEAGSEAGDVEPDTAPTAQGLSSGAARAELHSISESSAHNGGGGGGGALPAASQRRASAQPRGQRRSSMTRKNEGPVHPHALSFRRKKSLSEAVINTASVGKTAEGTKTEGNAALGLALFLGHMGGDSEMNDMMPGGGGGRARSMTT
jgi:hypothetical protein